MPLRSLVPRQLQTSNKDILEPSPNIFTLTIPSCRYQCRQHQSTLVNLLSNECFTISSINLEEDFCLRKDTYLIFSPRVNNSITRDIIGCFQVNIKNVVKHMNHIYYCCSRFLNLLDLENISDNDLVLIAIFKTYILHCYDLNICYCCSGSFNFYCNY